MSQKVTIEQTDIVIEDIGATTKSVAQLVADYPDVNAGRLVLSETEIYYSRGNNAWKVFTELPDFLAYTDRDNDFDSNQTIKGWIKTQAPSGQSPVELMFGETVYDPSKTYEIDPNKYTPVFANGSLVKWPILREVQQISYNTHPLSFASTSGAACSANAPTDYYSDSESLVVGVSLKTDTALTNPVNAGFYSDGTTYYQLDGTGTIIAKGQCTVATTNSFANTNGPATIHYDGVTERTLFFSGSLPGTSASPNPIRTADIASNPANKVGERPMSGTSAASQLTIVINADQNITCFSNCAIYDGSNSYAGVVSGIGTKVITITFNIGTAKGRNFVWDGQTNNEIDITPTS